MSDQPENLILYRLDLIHRQNNRIIETVDHVAEDMRDLKIRITAVGEALSGVNRRLDRHEDRLAGMERRLDPVGTAQN